MSSIPQAPYLTTEEAAKALGLTRRTVVRFAAEYKIPVLHLGRAIRVEARWIDRTAPAPEPLGDLITTPQLAAHWRVSRDHVLRLVASGALQGRQLASRQKGQYTTYVFTRRAVARFLADNTTGPDGGVVLMRAAS